VRRADAGVLVLARLLRRRPGRAAAGRPDPGAARLLRRAHLPPDRRRGHLPHRVEWRPGREPGMTGHGKTALVVMGVAGSGKSTVAGVLAERLGWPVADADDFHSPENVAKMSAGTPLTDEDRWPWLASIRDWISGADGSVVVT